MNKKKWITVIVVLVLIIAGLVGYLVYQGGKGEEKKLINELEKVGQADQTKEFGDIPISYKVAPGVSEEAKKIVGIKYQVDEGLLDLGKLTAGLTITNNSEVQTIEKAVISLVVLDKSGNVLTKSTKTIMKDVGRGVIKPRETRVYEYFFDQINLKLLKDIGSFAVILEQVELKGSTSPPTTTAITTPTVAQGSPGQTVKDFYQAWIDGRYDDMLKYISSSDINKMSLYQNWKQLWAESQAREYKVRPIGRIEILRENISGDKANMEYTVYYKNGSTENLGINLIKEESGWKVIQ
jgi:hypothetical protein